jgi:hypothetical protein
MQMLLGLFIGVTKIHAPFASSALLAHRED